MSTPATNDKGRGIVIMNKRYQLNPTIAILIMFSLGFILTFASKIWLNILIILVCLSYIFYCHVTLKKISLALLIAFPFSFGSWLSFVVYSHSYFDGWLYATRIYAYFGLGGIVTLCFSLKEILLSLQQHFKVPNTFVYGILSSIGLVQNVKLQIRKIQTAAKMHNQNLNWWNPMLYLKIIVSCLRWSEELATSMKIEGFSEDYPRTTVYHDSISIKQWALYGILTVSCFFAAIS